MAARAYDNSDKLTSPASTRHKQMYKCSTPPWKDTFRQRCRDRLNSNRDALVHRFRLGLSMTENESLMSQDEMRNMMSEEWNALKKQNVVSHNEDSQEDVDKLLSIFDEVSRELFIEEQAILAEYEKQQALEEADLSNLLESTSPSRGSCGSCVICPICMRFPLYLDQTVLRCNCGLYLDTEQDAVTLEMIGRNLSEGTEHHANNCTQRPQFSVVNHCGVINNLLMTCSVPQKRAKIRRYKMRDYSKKAVKIKQIQKFTSKLAECVR